MKPIKISGSTVIVATQDDGSIIAEIQNPSIEDIYEYIASNMNLSDLITEIGAGVFLAAINSRGVHDVEEFYPETEQKLSQERS